MDHSICRLATPEENTAFNRTSAIAYREVTTGQVVSLCQGDVEMLEACREDSVLPHDFHACLVGNFLGALSNCGIDYGGDGFWNAKPEDRAFQFGLLPHFLEPEDGEELTVDPIRVMHGEVIVAYFLPFRVQSTA